VLSVVELTLNKQINGKMVMKEEDVLYLLANRQNRYMDMYWKKIAICFTLVVLSFPAYSQLFGVGGQYAQKANGQFFANIALPTFTKDNPLHLFNMSGIEYTTPGGSRLSGLNIKPIQLSTYLSDKIFYESPFVLSLGVDAGYLFDFRSNHKNSIVLTPNIYADYKIFFIKAGYDMDTFHGNHQFFVRAGIGFTLGTMKHFTAK